MSAPRAVLVVNARSRRAGALQHRLAPALARRGVVLDAVRVVRDPARDLVDVVTGLLDAAPGMLVLAGGDGTLASVVDHLAGRPTVLGYLPLGTTNNTGRSLGLPLRLGAALDVVAHGRTARVDLGDAGGDLFSNLVSVGVSSVVAGRTPHGLKRALGRGAYALTAAAALHRHPPFTAHVEVDGRTWTVRTHQLNVANGRVHAGVPVAADAWIDDHLLTVYALGGPARGSTVLAAAAQAATPWRAGTVKGHRTGTHVRVVTDRVLPLDVDGEVTGVVGPDAPLDVRVAPAALRVRVPARRGDPPARREV